MEQFKIDVPVRCGKSTHTVSIVDGAIVLPDHPNGFDADGVLSVFGAEPAGCLKVFQSIRERSIEGVPEGLHHHIQASRERHFNRESNQYIAAQYHPFRSADEWLGSCRSWRTALPIMSRLVDTFAAAQDRRVGGGRYSGNRTIEIDWNDKSAAFVHGSAYRGRLELKATVSPRWMRSVARFGLATTPVAMQGIVTEVADFDENGPLRGWAAMWVPDVNASLVRSRREKMPSGVKVESREVKFCRDRGQWRLELVPPPRWENYGR